MTPEINTRLQRCLLCAVVLCTAFALRLWDLPARSLWFDEATEYWDAASFDISNVQAMSARQDPPLFSLLMRGWMVLGRDEFTLRFTSVAFSLLTVAGVVLLARRLFDLRTALLSGIIVALLPTDIRYAQEFGQYAPLVCLVTWGLIGLDLIARGRVVKGYVLWVVCAVAGAYLHYGAIVGILPPMGAMMLGHVWRKNGRALLRDGVSLLVYGLAILPLLIFLLPAQLHQGPTTAAFHVNFGSPLAELDAFWTSTQHVISFQLSGWPWTVVPEWICTLLFVALLAAGIIAIVRNATQARGRFLGWLALTWAAAYGFGKLNLYPYSYRYALILAPMLIVCIAYGLGALFRHRRAWPVGVVLAVYLLVILLVSLPNRTIRDSAYLNLGWLWPETSDLRESTQYWLSHREPSVPIYVYYAAMPGFRYYLHQAGYETQPLPGAWYATCWGPSDAFCTDSIVFYGKWLRTLTAQDKVVSLQGTFGQMPQRFWLIFSGVYPDEDRALLSQLAVQYQISEVYRLHTDTTYVLNKR